MFQNRSFQITNFVSWAEGSFFWGKSLFTFIYLATLTLREAEEGCSLATLLWCADLSTHKKRIVKKIGLDAEPTGCEKIPSMYIKRAGRKDPCWLYRLDCSQVMRIDGAANRHKNQQQQQQTNKNLGYS